MSYPETNQQKKLRDKNNYINAQIIVQEILVKISSEASNGIAMQQSKQKQEYM